MGTPLAVGEPLLLTGLYPIRSPKAPAPLSGLFCKFDWWNFIRRFIQFR
jgi:hypothetical protein